MRLVTRLAVIAAFAFTAHAAQAVVTTSASWTATVTYTGDISFGALAGTWSEYITDTAVITNNGADFEQSSAYKSSSFHTTTGAQSVQFVFNNSVTQNDKWTYMNYYGELAQAFHVGAGGGSVLVSYSYSGHTSEAGQRAGSAYNETTLAVPNPLGFGNNGAGVRLDNVGTSLTKQGSFAYNFAAGQAANETLKLDWNAALGDTSAPRPPVPEPETWALMGLGLVALVGRSVSRRRKARA